ncbi:strawberry notch-like NTP hydrolase domain-containing protein [Vibrio sp. 10N.237.312.C02]
MQIVAISGNVTKQQGEMLKGLGFTQLGITNPTRSKVFASMKYTKKEPIAKGDLKLYQLVINKIEFDKLQEIFPNSEMVNTPTSELKGFWEGFAKNTPEAQFSSVNSVKSQLALQSAESIGLNENGTEIFLTSTNDRYCLNGENLMFAKKRNSNAFMEFDWLNSSSKLAAAKSLMAEMEQTGQAITPNRLDQIIETGGESIRLTSNRAAEVQTDIIINLNSLLLNDIRSTHNKESINLETLSTLNDNMANMPHSHRDSMFSKPLPPAYSFVARSFLEAIDNCESLTVINDKTTSLATLIPSEMPIRFMKEQGNRHELYSTAFQNEFGKTSTSLYQAGNQAVTPGSQILLATNQGSLNEPLEIFGVTVNYQAELEAVQTLNTMNDNSQAMIVMNADDSYSLGTVSMESYDVHNHIFQNFNVVDMFDASPIIFGDNEEVNAKRVYLINGKKPIPSSTNAPTDIKALYSVNDIYEVSLALKDAFVSTITSKPNLKSTDLTSTTSISDILANYTSNQTESSKYDLNFAQSRYTPLTSLSRANDMAAMPSNFVNANREAVIKLIKDVGNPDQFLMSEMGMTSEEITSVWDAEQIDAITLGIWRLKNNKPFLQGDATGKGKGRTLAAYMAWSVKQGRTPIFMTSKPDLLNDIYRDIRDTGLDKYIDPFFLMPDGKDIVDKSQNSVIFDSKSITKTKGDYLEGNYTSINENLICTTYSQINGLKSVRGRKKVKIEDRINDRAKWLIEFAKNNNVQFLFDESHNIASKDTNSNAVIDLLKDQSQHPTIRASATWAKNEKNIAQCSDLFPEEFTPQVLEKMVRQGGTTFIETLSTTLIAEGAMVRREHNYGKRIVNIIESKQQQRNKIATDTLSEIMQKVKEYGREIFKGIAAISRFQHQHKDVDIMSFAGTYSIITESFVEALRSEEIARSAIYSINNSEKPIIGVDKTAEQQLRFLYDSICETEGIESGKPIELAVFPDFKVALDRWLIREGNRKVKVTIEPTPAQIAAANKIGEEALPTITTEDVHWRSELDITSPTFQKLDALEKEVSDLISKMPTLPLSPIDVVKTELAKQGMTSTEVSGRKLHVRLSDDGNGYVIEPTKFDDKPQAQYDFNSNKANAIIVTRSGTEGISLHAQGNFKQTGAQNRRHTFLMSSFFDVTQEEQLFGRGERKGQVTTSKSSKVITGMPVEARLLAISERNRLRLSASTTGNSQSIRATNTIPNLMNNFGNNVVAEYLSEQQEIMELLDFSQSEQQNIQDFGSDAFNSNEISSLSTKVLGRMSLLNYEQQNSLLDELTSFYNSKLEAERSKGLDPINTRMVSGKITTIKESTLSGTTKTHYVSEFEKPVILEQIKLEHPPIQMNTEVLETNIHRSLKSLSEYLQKPNSNLTELGIHLIKLKEKGLERALLQHNQSALVSLRNRSAGAATISSVEEALAMPDSNKVKTALRNFETISILTKSVKIGQVLNIQDGRKIVISNLEFPKDNHNILNPWLYNVEYYSTKGEIGKKMSAMTFSQYFSGPEDVKNNSLGMYSNDHAINEEFRSLKLSGGIEFINILKGNIVEAARLNAETRMGSQIILKDLDNGRSVPVIRARKDLTFEKIMNQQFGANHEANGIILKHYELNLQQLPNVYIFDHISSIGSDTKQQGAVIIGDAASPIKIKLPKTKAGRRILANSNPFDSREVFKDGFNKKTGLYSEYYFDLEDSSFALEVLNDAGFNILISGNELDLLKKQTNRVLAKFSHSSTQEIDNSATSKDQMTINDAMVALESEADMESDIEVVLENSNSIENAKSEIEESLTLAGGLPEIEDDIKPTNKAEVASDKSDEEISHDLADLVGEVRAQTQPDACIAQPEKVEMEDHSLSNTEGISDVSSELIEEIEAAIDTTLPVFEGVHSEDLNDDIISSLQSQVGNTTLHTESEGNLLNVENANSIASNNPPNPEVEDEFTDVDNLFSSDLAVNENVNSPTSTAETVPNESIDQAEHDEDEVEDIMNFFEENDIADEIEMDEAIAESLPMDATSTSELLDELNNNQNSEEISNLFSPTP